MVYTAHYRSPLGGILMAADEEGLTGLWFEGQKYFARGLAGSTEERETPASAAARRWLDEYFAGREPRSTPPLHLVGTEHQRAVWDVLLSIPYGRTMTYGQIASRLAESRARVSAQAVGGAVGRNPVSIIVPCHRVVGADGSLTGYAGGIEKRLRLLELEGVDMSALYIPRQGTAL